MKVLSRTLMMTPSSSAQRNKLRFKPSTREVWLLATLALVGAGVTTLWRPIQQHWLTWLLLRADAPAQAVVDELVARDPHPDLRLSRLWQDGGIPHHLAVLEHLHAHSASGKLFSAGTAAVLIEAARSGDLEAKEKAFTILAIRQHPDLCNLAVEQLRDVDPAVRALGLQYLTKAGDRRLVPAVLPLLQDPDPRVVARAGRALARWTGNDFGIRLSLALPQFERATPVATDQAALSRGVARWQEWWQRHRPEYAAFPDEIPPAPSRWGLPAKDFSLEDLAGSRVSLAELRGKTVWLSFFDSTATNAASFLSELADVQQRNTGRYAILGISLDATAPERTHSHGDAHVHHTEPSSSLDLRSIRAGLRRWAQAHNVTHPILIDIDGAVGRRFSALELPTHVIIDPAGTIRRRFVGPRSSAVVEAMLAAAEAGQAPKHTGPPR